MKEIQRPLLELRRLLLLLLLILPLLLNKYYQRNTDTKRNHKPKTKRTKIRRTTFDFIFLGFFSSVSSPVISLFPKGSRLKLNFPSKKKKKEKKERREGRERENEMKK